MQRNREEHMNMLKIPHNALVFVGDGRKALFLRNDGDAKFPNLRAEKVFEEGISVHARTGQRPARTGERGRSFRSQERLGAD